MHTSDSTATVAVPSNSDYVLELPRSVHLLYGAVSIGGSLAYVLFGVSCNQMVWYFRSYPRDPLLFKTFIGIILAVNIMNFFWIIGNLYYIFILRGIGTDLQRFVVCDHWTLNAVLVLTELCCCFVELFFILRMWRFAEKKHLTILAFIPYIASAVFNLIYLHGMFKIPCYPEMIVNRIWLILAYSFKILSDGVIAGTMIWLLCKRSRGVRRQGGTIRVVRILIYWAVSTGLVLWISTIVYLSTYTLLSDTYVCIAVYVTRGQIYVVAMLAVTNDRKRCQAVMQRPESISLRTTTIRRQRTAASASTTDFWKSMTDGVYESDIIDTQSPVPHRSSSGLE